jgi:hypothetical protein
MTAMRSSVSGALGVCAAAGALKAALAMMKARRGANVAKRARVICGCPRPVAARDYTRGMR